MDNYKKLKKNRIIKIQACPFAKHFKMLFTNKFILKDLILLIYLVSIVEVVSKVIFSGVCVIFKIYAFTEDMNSSFFGTGGMNTIALKCLGLGLEMLKLRRKMHQLHVEIPAPQQYFSRECGWHPDLGTHWELFSKVPWLVKSQRYGWILLGFKHPSVQFSLKQFCEDLYR